MYSKINNGSSVDIQGLKCWIPPVGQVYNVLTKQYEKRPIITRSNKKAEQYWERQPVPDWLEAKQKREDEMKLTDPNYVEPELEKYRAQEWDRRLNGCWVMIKGEPVYLTGMHYMYLQWWCIDIGYPKFRVTDKEYFYFLQYCIEDPNCLGCLELTKRRAGKCFKIDTEIRMYDGSIKKVQDIRDGDFVMGDDSRERMVFGCTSGEEEMFEIIPNKGDSFTVNGSHILHCLESRVKDHKYYRRPINITVNEYLKLTNCKKKNLMLARKGWGEWDNKQHLIDPYFIGLWLGDGSSKSCEISNIDNEVILYIQNYAKRSGLRYRNYGALYSTGTRIRHSISCYNGIKVNYKGLEFKSKESLMDFLGKNRKTPHKGMQIFKNGEAVILEKKSNWIWGEMKKLNLPNNKHIPVQYKIDGRENRLRLLAGLLDTDGTLTKNKHYALTFSNKYHSLIKDAKELIQSLGFFCGVYHQKKANATTLTIFGDIWEIPCRVKRKIATKREKKYNSSLTGFEVKPAGVGIYYGFAVDDNHLFLLADGTIVHNSFRSGMFLYEYVSRMNNSNGGIQSKTQADAKKLFQRAVVAPFKRLPKFFRPEFDKSQGVNPKSELRFQQTNVKGRKAEDVLDKDELNSVIDYQSSEAVSYDGSKLHRYVADEAGKTSEVNVYDRHQIVMYCALNDEGKVIGKMLYTTTVEEMENGGESFKMLWDDSDQTKKGENKRTPSGLYRYFTPAYRTRNFDIYGYPDEEQTLKDIQEERATLINSPRALSARIRKEPLTVQEAFRIDGDKCLFDSMKLNERLDYLSWNEELIERGSFEWEGGTRDGKVIWVKSRNGRWKMPKGFYFEKDEDTNKIIKVGHAFRPANKLSFVAAIDPYDHDNTEDHRRSMAAAYVLKKNNPMENSPFNRAFVCQYFGRPDYAAIVYEDMIKMCHYFGCQILYESNKPGIKRYFQERGYNDFLIHLPDYNEPGIPSTVDNKRTLAELTEEYITNHINSVFFKELIQQWLEFDLKDTQKFDLVMAAGWTLVADMHKLAKREISDVRDIKEYFSEFKIA